MAGRFDFMFREVTSGLRRNGLVAFAAVSTTFIALLLLGLALLISRQVTLMITATTGNVEVAVYLSDPVNPQTVQTLTNKVERLDAVADVHYQTKEEACVLFKELFKTQTALVQNVNCDSLPASLRVKMADPERFREVAGVLGCVLQDVEGVMKWVCAEPGIDNLVDQSEFLDRLFAVTRVFRWGVLIVSVVMLIAAAILIANTVRMGLFARRKEIGIMKLVGATNWRIRAPFLLEGLFESLIGAGAAILCLFGLKVAFINPLYGKIRFVPWVTNADVLAVIPWLLVAGAAVAVSAAMVGMRRFLDV